MPAPPVNTVDVRGMSDEVLIATYLRGPGAWAEPAQWEALAAEWRERFPAVPELLDEVPPLLQQGLIRHAEEELGARAAPAAIIDFLVSLGIPRPAAAQVVNRLHVARVDHANERLVKGALWFFGGAAVTIASGMSGGTSIIAWGAILYGAIQLVDGLTGPKAEAPRGPVAPVISPEPVPAVRTPLAPPWKILIAAAILLVAIRIAWVIVTQGP